MTNETENDWDAVAYDSLPLPHVQWGLRTINRLQLTGDETVLEAGCGTGRDAMLMLNRLPQGRLVAVDGSETMLLQFRQRLAGAGLADRVELLHADLMQPLAVDTPVDAIYSVATLHWLPDHAVVFRNFADALKPGGQLSTDCGGQGNLSNLVVAVARVLGNKPASLSLEFAGVEDTQRRLFDAGFVDAKVWLEDCPTPLPSRELFELYLRTITLRAELDQLPKDQHGEFVSAVADLLPDHIVDHVRLNISAQRS